MESLGNSLADLVKYLQEITPKIWAILLKQQNINGWSNIIIAACLLLLFLLLFIAMKRLKKGRETCKYSSDEDSWNAGMFGVGFIQVACLIAIPILVVNGIKILLNPEYFAILELLNSFK